MQNMILQYILAPALIAVITWFLAKRKYNANVEKTEIKNVEEVIGIWKSTAMDLKKRVEEQQAIIDLQQKEIAKLTVENQKHEWRIAKLENYLKNK